MTSDVRIADVEAGRPVEGVYAVVRKQRRHDKNGDAYLVLELSDPTGRIEGRVWKDADWFDRNIHEGDRVRAIGRGSSFRDQLQLDIRRLDKVEGEPTESYVPASTRDLADLAGELDFLTSEIQHEQQHELVEAVWNGPHRDTLVRSPATANDHHAHLGGLVEHTVSVAAICMTVAERHDRIDRDLLLTAALLHDVGRARELRADTHIEADADGSLVGHLLLGHELLLDAARHARIEPSSNTTWWPRLVHAINMHHGPAERCRTREALILANANSLDARLAQRDR